MSVTETGRNHAGPGRAKRIVGETMKVDRFLIYKFDDMNIAVEDTKHSENKREDNRAYFPDVPAALEYVVRHSIAPKAQPDDVLAQLKRIGLEVDAIVSRIRRAG